MGFYEVLGFLIILWGILLLNDQIRKLYKRKRRDFLLAFYYTPRLFRRDLQRNKNALKLLIVRKGEKNGLAKYYTKLLYYFSYPLLVSYALFET